jgi:hypothetical protein
LASFEALEALGLTTQIQMKHFAEKFAFQNVAEGDGVKLARALSVFYKAKIFPEISQSSVPWNPGRGAICITL